MQPAGASAGGVPSGAGSADPGRDRPRFRQDLIAETVEHHGARFIDVMAPEGNDVFRFYEVEYSLACGMDGERDVAGIVKWAQDELGLTPSLQEVRTVIAALGELGFIEPGEAAAAEADSEPELAVGAVAEPAARAARPTPSGFDFGAAEADHGDTERGAALPVAPDLALGADGPPRSARPTPQAHDAALEPPGPARRSGLLPAETSDVSLDLADHIEVRPDDVKEAVRASQMMSAVEPPPDSDVLEVIQDPPTAPASAFDAPTVARIPDPAMLAELTPRPPPSLARSPEPPPSTRRSDSVKAQQDLPTADTIRVGKSQLRAPATSVKPPVELPAAPVTVKVDKPMPPPAARTGTSPLLLVVLILAIGAGVFFAWKYVLERPAIDVDTSSAPVPAPVKPAPPPPPPPPPPSAKIALETPDPEDVKVMRQGVIESIPAGDTAVKETEVIAKLKGYKPLEAQVNAMNNDLTRQRGLLDAAIKVFEAAHAAGNKAKETAAQSEVAERRKLIGNKESAFNAKRADLDTYQVRAPRNGTFSPSTKPNAAVVADSVIGKLKRDPIPVATFKLGNTHSFAGNGSVEIAIHKAGEQRVTCTVADVTIDSVKVVCPVDPDLTEGLEVALQAPAAASAAPPEPPPLPSGGAGSAGSAAPAEPAGGTGVPPPPPEAPSGGAAPGAPAGAGAPAPSGSAAPATGSSAKLPN
jgi:hypothetical protein